MNHVSKRAAAAKIAALFALPLFNALDALCRLAFFEGRKERGDPGKVYRQILVGDIAIQLHDVQLNLPIPKLPDKFYRFLAGTDDAFQLTAEHNISSLKRLKQLLAVSRFRNSWFQLQ